MHHYKILEKGKSLSEAKKAMVLLHGRGGHAKDIIGLADEFIDDDFYVAAPQADNNTWYPFGFMHPESSNEPWLSSAVETVKKLLDEIEKYIPSKNIFILGFSQGACLTLEVASRYATEYGGVVAFTGGLIGEKVLTERYKGDFKGTKVFIGNSDIDPHVPVERSEESKKVMENLGAKVILEIYPNMPHTISQEEIQTVKEWMFKF